MRLVDARRLRGPSLGASGPGAIAEIALEDGEQPARVERKIRAELDRLASGRGTSAQVRRYAGGLAVFVPLRIDALSYGVDLLEAAVEHLDRGRPDRERAIERLTRAYDDERNDALVRIESAAVRRAPRVPFLVDDDALSLGYGRFTKSWPLRDAPPPERVKWGGRRAIPVALVTGTNGKTTTTRLVARIAKLAGLVPGNTSSDGTVIDEVVVEAGDNTGGESARRVLRDPRVEIAILETARGGLLRRGLAVTSVDAALITNVTADHLGEHGVLDLATLVDTKAVVGHAVKKGGKVVLGADDPELVRIAPTFAAERVWFALDASAAAAPIARGEATFFVERGALVRMHRGVGRALVKLRDVPLADGGKAPHNVKNALAAAALAWSLGLPDAAVVAGLKRFGKKVTDNPGRGQVVTRRGVRVVLDFGHNPAAASDLYAWARALAGEKHRVHAVLTQPGDRTDEAIDGFARAVAVTGIASAFVWESEGLLRGRPAGAIQKRLLAALRRAKVRVNVLATEADAIRSALASAKKGDVVVVSPSLDRAAPR